MAHVAGHAVLHLIKFSFSFQPRVYIFRLMHSFTVISAHKAYFARKPRFFGLHFCHRQYGANFIWFDVVGFQTTEFIEVVKVVIDFGISQKPICDCYKTQSNSITKKVYISMALRE